MFNWHGLERLVNSSLLFFHLFQFLLEYFAKPYRNMRMTKSSRSNIPGCLTTAIIPTLLTTNCVLYFPL